MLKLLPLLGVGGFLCTSATLDPLVAGVLVVSGEGGVLVASGEGNVSRLLSLLLSSFFSIRHHHKEES